MFTKFLAPAAAICLSLSTMAPPTPAAAQTVKQHLALASDSGFIQSAGSLALLQVKLGKLAQEQATSEVVRDFAKRMVAEYSKTNQDLAAGAKQAAYPKPVLLRPHQNVYDRFNGMSKSAFDKSYMAEMVSEHDEMTQLFEREAKDGRVQSLKQLASSMLPSVQEHQALASQTATSVGADVTAATSQTQKGS